jgi:hypothetical protein
MGRLIRVKVNWTGFVGSPGYTNFHFEPVPESDPISQATVDSAVTKVSTFLTAIRPYLPLVVTTGIDPAVAEIDEQNGEIQTYWNATPPAATAGAMTGNYTAGAGFCVNWATGGVRKGRRVRGRTFIVPIGSTSMDTDGTFNASHLTAWRTAANALHVDSNGVRLVVWAKTPGAIIPDGGAYDVVTASINDKVAFLTSRRS